MSSLKAFTEAFIAPVKAFIYGGFHCFRKASMEASTGASMNFVEACMEVRQAYMEAVEDSTDSFMEFHTKTSSTGDCTVTATSTEREGPCVMQHHSNVYNGSRARRNTMRLTSKTERPIRNTFCRSTIVFLPIFLTMRIMR